jgi:hypothetical protein
MMDDLFPEHILTYPEPWEKEYRNTRRVKEWKQKFPDQFEDWMCSTRPGTLDLFAQYALMFLLRRDGAFWSITWYKLGDTSTRSKNRERTQKYWEIMECWMGHENFHILQSAIRKGGFGTFKGEPDLFCWNPKTGNWFFAEAKGRDRLTESQKEWISICRQALGDHVQIRVYRLIPECMDA